MLSDIKIGAMNWFNSLKTAIQDRNWSYVIVWLLPIILTVIVIALFKIKVWTPAKKSYSNYRKRRTYRRSYRRRNRRKR